MSQGSSTGAGCLLARAGVVLLVGCASSVEPRVEVSGAPQLVVAEGETITAEVTVVPLDVRVSGLAVEVAGDLQRYFDELEIREGAGGQPLLAITPRCDLVPPGGGSALVPFVVRTEPEWLAAPAQLTLLVEEQRGVVCQPRVLVWRDDDGACDQPVDDGDAFQFAPGEASTLCVQVRSLDPTAEPLWARIRSGAPPGLLEVPELGGGFAEATFAVTNHGSDVVRGEFEMRISVFPVDPADGEEEPVVSRSPALRFGAPGDIAIEVLGPDRVPATEFDVASVGLRLWRFDEPGAAPPCVRATRDDPPIDPVPRVKPFLRLYSAGAAQPVVAGELLQAEGPFTLALSPPIDARAVERVNVEAGACDEVGELAFAGETAVRQVVLDVTSAAEELSCPPGMQNPVPGAAETPAVACIDLVGEGTPQVFVRPDSGNACLFSGEANRHSALEWAAASGEVPTSVLALQWNGGTAGVQPVLLGEFPSMTRRLALADPVEPAAAWILASEQRLANVQVPLEQAQPLAMDPAFGATHIVYPQRPDTSWSLSIRCVSSVCATGPALVELPAVAASDQRVVGVAVADLDGDGAQDLLVASLPAAPGGGARPLQLVAIRLLWQDAANVDEDPEGRVVIEPVSVHGSVFRGVAVPVAAREDVYAVVGDGAFDASVLRVVGGTSFFDEGGGQPTPIGQEPYLATPGAARGIAVIDGELHVATSMGTWRRDGTAWVQLDPVLVEDALVGAATVVHAAYGGALTSCLGASAYAVTSTDLAIRYSNAAVTVGNP